MPMVLIIVNPKIRSLVPSLGGSAFIASTSAVRAIPTRAAESGIAFATTCLTKAVA